MQWLTENWETIRLALEIVLAVLALLGAGAVKIALVLNAVKTVLVARVEEAAANTPEAKRALKKKRIGDGLKRAGKALLENAAMRADPDKVLTKKKAGWNILKALFRL